MTVTKHGRFDLTPDERAELCRTRIKNLQDGKGDLNGPSRQSAIAHAYATLTAAIADGASPDEPST